MARSKTDEPQEPEVAGTAENPEVTSTEEAERAEVEAREENTTPEAQAAASEVPQQEGEPQQVTVVYAGEGENPKVSVPGHSEVELPATVDPAVAVALATGADVKVEGDEE